MNKCGLRGEHEPTYRDNGKWKHARVSCDCAEKLIETLQKKLKKALKDLK